MKDLVDEVQTMPTYAVVKRILSEQGKEDQNTFLSCVLLLAFPQPDKFVCSDTNATVGIAALQDIAGSSDLLRTCRPTLQCPHVSTFLRAWPDPDMRGLPLSPDGTWHHTRTEYAVVLTAHGACWCAASLAVCVFVGNEVRLLRKQIIIMMETASPGIDVQAEED